MSNGGMWMECFAGDARIEGNTVDRVVDRFIDHARESHDFPFPEEALRNYARNYAEANLRLSGNIERLADIGEVTIRPVTESRVDHWTDFFDRDAFAGNPDWASCYCLEPHVPPTEEMPERPWREVRAAMIDRLRNGGTYGYLAYVDGTVAGWVNASLRSDYGRYADVEPDGPNPASVIGVSCFIIAPPYRRHGLAANLLDHVIADAGARGADWIEGYPYNEPDDGDPGHYRGPRALYDARGFSPIEVRETDTVVRRPARTG